ncbi:MAG: hydrolase [Clostridiales bacterium]|nr:hydrolase [Clostridiales bacterium]
MEKPTTCLLSPADAAVVIIDHQPQMYFGVESGPRDAVMNGVLGLAKTAQVFGVPCILTTVVADTFSGPIISKLQSVYPDTVPLDRTAINAWQDARLKAAVQKTMRKKILLAGLWTEACVTFPALAMKNDGYDVYVVTDACAGATKAAHYAAIQRMIQAGVVPVTWQQVLLEFQRDWANDATYPAVMSVIKEHGSAYGLGVEYTEAML